MCLESESGQVPFVDRCVSAKQSMMVETYVDGMKAVRVKNMEDILTAWQKERSSGPYRSEGKNGLKN